MKKICFLSGDITRSGGTEKVACQIMNGLVTRYNISVISLTHSSDKMFYSLSPEIKRVALFQSNPNGIKQYFSIVHQIRKYLKINKIDILIDIDTILDMFSVVAVHGTRTKLIAWEHFNFSETMGNKLRVPIRKHMTKYADCVVTLTKEDQKTYSDYFGKKLRVEQIYNPVEIIETKGEYNLNSKVIVSVGRLARQKGFDYLLRVAEIVFEKHSDWEWIILGEGDERGDLEKTIKDKNLTQVKLIGRVNNVDEYFRKSSMFVMTSRYEGFPLVLIEAKANKLPVVSFKCKTGPAELVQDGVNGYLVDCFNTNAIAEKVCNLIEDTEKRNKFSKNALLDTEKLNYQEIMKQWENLLNELIRGGAMSEMTRKRIEWVDILKGFAILLVMLGHTKTVPAFLKIWLYSFHIPLFFFLSGYVYNGKKYKTLRALLFQKFTTLLWPMMTYSVICGVIDCVVDSNFSFHSLLCRMVGMFIELRGSSLDSGLWFIVCLFVTEIVYWIIEKKCQYNLKRIGISVLFLGIVGTGYICFCGRIIPWALDASCIAIVFFYTGDLFKKYKEVRNNSTIIFGVSFVTSVVVVFSECVYFGRTDLYANQLGFFPLYYLGGFAGIFCTTIFARTIAEILSLKLLKFIGRNSIIFYAFHKTIFKTFDLILQKLQFNIGSIEWIVYMIAGVGSLSIISWFLKKYMGFLNRCPMGR